MPVGVYGLITANSFWRLTLLRARPERVIFLIIGPGTWHPIQALRAIARQSANINWALHRKKSRKSIFYIPAAYRKVLNLQSKLPFI